ncbi:amidase domain-containing protein [Streptomyces sp. NBC_01006]|uniref:amidase domain-containing protein n=1 Tax=Streptomyces sp. NBC_01006 TaxID=2903716 RepID=UPI0038664A36
MKETLDLLDTLLDQVSEPRPNVRDACTEEQGHIGTVNGLIDEALREASQADAKASAELDKLAKTLADLKGLPPEVGRELRGPDGKIDRVEMVRYALDHWDKRDDLDHGASGNCTNFVSSSLEAGGMKQWRGLAMRTDKLAIAYQAALHLAALLIWTRR